MTIPEPQPPIEARDLSRTFQDMLGRAAWAVDAPLEPAPGDVPSSLPPRPDEVRPRSPGQAVTPPPAMRIVEAMLFLGSSPLTPQRGAEVLRGMTADQFQDLVDELNHLYRQQGRPYLVQKHGQGYVLTLRPAYRFVVDKLRGGVREARLTPQGVEVLAVVAYRQPVTRQEVDSLRGRDSAPILRQLVRRGLIALVSRAESGGRDVQYGTTPRFLELFGLSSLEELPETEDLQRL